MRTKVIPLLTIILGLVSGHALAIDEMTIVSTTADPGDTGVMVTVQGTNDLAFQGLSIALEYDTARIDCVGASVAGTVVEAASPGGTPDFMAVQIDDAVDAETGIATIGIIFELAPVNLASVAASPDTAQDWVHLLFDVSVEALPGVADVVLNNGVGTPPTDNNYSSFGFPVLPAISGGTLTVNNNFEIRIPDLTVGAGQTLDATVLGTFPMDLNGFQVSVTYDNSFVTITDYADPANWTSGLDSENTLPVVALPIEFFNVQVVSALASDPGTGWVGLSAILDNLPLFDGQVIPAGVDKSLVRLELNINGGVMIGDSTEIMLTNSGVFPDVNLDNVYVVQNGLSALPMRTNGVIDVDVAVGGFRRSDANVDSAVNVADAIYIINYQFTGGPAPQCFDSSDANDDGTVNVADVIHIINYQFTGGPAPVAPGPTICGPDPTPDSLACGSYPSC